MEANSGRLFLSVATIAELVDGVAKLQREGASRKAGVLSGWLESMLLVYGNRVLIADIEIARLAGSLSDRARGAGYDPGFADALVGATAAHHGLTLLTRNMRHFTPFGIAAVNPYERLPD